MAKDYKLNVKELWSNSFLFMCGLVAAVALYSIIAEKLPPSIDLNFKIMGAIACGVIVLAVLFITIEYFLNGDFYYRIVYVPIKDLEARLYNNMLILAYDNDAWHFTHKFKEIAKKDKIRVIKYYNRKKKYLSYKISPYD